MSALYEISRYLALILQLAAQDPASLALSEPGGSIPHEASDLAYSETRWLDALTRHGAHVGEGLLAERIFRTRSGLIYVPIESERSRIVALRRDGALAIAVTRQSAADNANWLASVLGRAPTTRELFVAHVSSRDEARRLMAIRGLDIAQPAAAIAPEAALAHPALFFSGTRPRTIAEVNRLIELALAKAEQPVGEARQMDVRAGRWKTITMAAEPVERSPAHR